MRSMDRGRLTFPRVASELESDAMTTISEPQTQPAREAAAAPARQFVNFMFFKTDRSWRREIAEVKSEAKRDFAEIGRRHTGPMMVLPYSTVGLKPNTAFMVWRIG